MLADRHVSLAGVMAQGGAEGQLWAVTLSPPSSVSSLLNIAVLRALAANYQNTPSLCSVAAWRADALGICNAIIAAT